MGLGYRQVCRDVLTHMHTHTPVHEQKQTFAALIAVVVPTSCTIVAFHASRRVHTFAVTVASAVVLLALIHI